MSRLYDTVEPSVIDDKMLKTCIEEQGPKEEAGNVAKKDGIDYEDVLSLRLDFLSKLKSNSFYLFEFFPRHPKNRKFVAI